MMLKQMILTSGAELVFHREIEIESANEISESKSNMNTRERKEGNVDFDKMLLVQ